MPKLHKYVNKEGMYIRSLRQKKMVTYQLRPEGIRELRSQGYMDESTIPEQLLNQLLERKLIFTHGGGAGDVDLVSQQKPKIESPRSVPKQAANQISTAYDSTTVSAVDMASYIDKCTVTPISPTDDSKGDVYKTIGPNHPLSWLYGTVNTMPNEPSNISALNDNCREDKGPTSLMTDPVSATSAFDTMPLMRRLKSKIQSTNRTAVSFFASDHLLIPGWLWLLMYTALIVLVSLLIVRFSK